MVVSQVIDDGVKTLQSTETLRKLHSTDFASKAAKDEKSFSITSADSYLKSVDNTTNKPLEGDMATMKSSLTGQDNTVKRRIQTQNGFHSHNKAEKLARRCHYGRSVQVCGGRKGFIQQWWNPWMNQLSQATLT